MGAPDIGEAVTVRLRKWDGSAHRRSPMVYLGSDEYGHWLGNQPDYVVWRPGAFYTVNAATVMLVPADDRFIACFNAVPSPNCSYTDITSAPEFRRDESGWSVHAVDLELDVFRRRDGRIWIDDEDEFAEHAAKYAYPPDVVARTRATADAVLEAVRKESEPFGAVAHRWFDQLRAVVARN